MRHLVYKTWDLLEAEHEEGHHKSLITFLKDYMDQLIERISSLVRKGNDLFQQERPVQYGVLGGYLVLWLLISGSLTQTLMVGLAMGLAWMVGTRKGD